MIKVNEYYVYVSGPSRYPVEYRGQGRQAVWSDDKKEVIYDKETGLFLKTDGEYRCINTLKRVKDGHYISEGAVLPAQYLGTGNSILFNDKGKEIYRKSGHIFMLYTVPVVLDASEILGLIHPTECIKEVK